MSRYEPISVITWKTATATQTAFRPHFEATRTIRPSAVTRYRLKYSSARGLPAASTTAGVPLLIIRAMPAIVRI